MHVPSPCFFFFTLFSVFNQDFHNFQVMALELASHSNAIFYFRRWLREIKEVFELSMHLNLCREETTDEDLYILYSVLGFGNHLIMFSYAHMHFKTPFLYEHDRVPLEVEW